MTTQIDALPKGQCLSTQNLSGVSYLVTVWNWDYKCHMSVARFSDEADALHYYDIRQKRNRTAVFCTVTMWRIVCDTNDDMTENTLVVQS